MIAVAKRMQFIDFYSRLDSQNMFFFPGQSYGSGRLVQPPTTELGSRRTLVCEGRPVVKDARACFYGTAARRLMLHARACGPAKHTVGAVLRDIVGV